MSRYRENNIIAKTGVKVIPLSPKNDTQEELLDCSDNLVITGPAGTGKTLLSMYIALCGVMNNQYDRVVIIRSAVPARDIGFLPGSLSEKIEVYEEPYSSAVKNITERGDSYNILKKHGIIEFATTSYLRGMTLDNSVVIVDECQNMIMQELDTTITRLGEGSKIMFLGDVHGQCDLDREISGFSSFIRLLELTGYFSFFWVSAEDCVRSGLVRSYLQAKAGVT